MRLIRIIHHAGQRMEFILLSEFFRLTGIYVQEYQVIGPKSWLEGMVPEPLEQDNRIVEKRNYDVSLWIMSHKDKDKVKEQEQEQAYVEEQGYIPVEPFKTDQMVAREGQRKYLRAVLASIGNWNGNQFQQESKDLKKLEHIYTNCNLVYHAYNIRYFTAAVNQQNYHKGFSRAYEAAKMLEGESGKGYLIFFKVNCARKVNEACDKLGWLREYSSRRLISEVIVLAGKTKNGWHNPYVLAALIAEQEPDLLKDVPHYYKEAVFRDPGYDSYMYYRLGRFYEKVSQKRSSAMLYYKKSLSIDPTYYRSSFKVAYLHEYEGGERLKESWALFNRIRDRMLLISQYGALEPGEIEYLLKVYHRLARIARFRMNRLFLSEKMIGEIFSYLEELEIERFFEQFYCRPGEGEKMFEQMKDRLPLKGLQKERKELKNMLCRYREIG